MLPAPRRRLVRRTLPLLAAAGLLLAGPAGGSAVAAARPAPCPTVGTTLARDVAPNLRVWREGTALKACVRRAGERRTVRSLGVWTSGTKVATGRGTVSWTSTGQSDLHGLVDAIATVDVRSGTRWFQTARAALAPDVATPAGDDRVLRVITNDRATAWVTARGVVGAALRRVDADALAEWSPGEVPYHVGRRFFLGDAGAPDAAAVAKGLAFDVGGESDECGGTDLFRVRVPGYADTPARAFVYATAPSRTAPGC